MSCSRAAGFLGLTVSLALLSSCTESRDTGTTPEITVSVTPSSASLTAGTSQTFSASVGGTSNTAVTWSVADASAGSVTSAGVYTAPAAAGTYHVKATSNADASKSDSAVVAVIPAPAITSFTAGKITITAGTTTTITAQFTGGTGSVDNGVGAVTSGTPLSVGALTTNTTYTLTVTNALGATATQTLTVNVVEAPAITSFSAQPSAIGSGGTTTLTAVFGNGTAIRRPDNVVMTSGTGSTTGPLTGTTDYRLVVTNPAGDSVSAIATVVVVTAPPVINSFTATPSLTTAGDVAMLAWGVANAATISIDQFIGPVTGTSRPVLPVTTTTYTLTATNPAGSVNATATVTVYPEPAISSFTTAQSPIAPGASTTLTANFTHGTGSIDQGIGSVTSGVPVSTGALTANRTYTLTVINPAGRTVSRIATVTIDHGFFAGTANMSTARFLPASVTLADGKVLVIGGDGSGGNTAETYDPAAGTWSPTTGAPVLRRGFAAATLLADGRVLVTGGMNSGAYLSSAELYDPATGTFSPTVGSMTGARRQHSATLLANGEVLVAGGHTGDAVSSAEIYNPITGTFRTTGSMGTARWGHHTVLLPNGKVLVIGGSAAVGEVPLEQFDPGTDSFQPLAGTTPPAVGAVRLTSGKILIAAKHTNSAWLWDSGTLTPIANQIRRRPTASHVLLSDGMVLVAGDSGASEHGQGRSEAEIFNPATSTFKLTGATLTRRGNASLHLLTTGMSLMFGGSGEGGGFLNTAELYSSTPPLPVAPLPAANVTAPGGATAGQAGITASVPATAGARYIWYVNGGTITAGLRTNSITITAGPAGQLRIYALVVSSLGMPANGTATVTVSP